MKFKFSLKNKEASLEADVENLIEKKMDYNAKSTPKKTRYQFKQEEKRKNKELEFKQQKFWMFVMAVLIIVLAILGVIVSFLGI